MRWDDLPIPEGAEQVDAQWMGRVLRADGALGRGRVAAVRCTPVGTGLIGDSFRFVLTCEDAPDSAPASLVGKFARRDAQGNLHKTPGHLREVSFYRDLAPDAGPSVPRPYFSRIDPSSSPFALILEDFGPARSVDQLAGCSVDDAQTALVAAAALHARFWDDRSLERFGWLGVSNDGIDQLGSTVAGFRQRYAEHLEPEWLGLLDRLAGVARRMMTGAVSPHTLQHGDFRLDNVLYDIQAGSRPMGVLDWQTVNLGPPLVDIAYFLCTGLDPDQRRAHERELVAGYHAELVRRGVAGYPFEDCWYDYRRFGLRTVQVGVQAPMFARRSERSDALFLRMLRNGCAMALDHGSLDLCEA